ncbi:hypothetical protein, partial [Ralstonia solanacearum]|uniref:hypothetical protein n=1 Tax=Ralstonia solanacearum TaxID=305 RepID=UPI0019D35693
GALLTGYPKKKSNLGTWPLLPKSQLNLPEKKILVTSLIPAKKKPPPGLNGWIFLCLCKASQNFTPPK